MTNSRLLIPITFTCHHLSLLLDTGSEVNLVRRDLFPPQLLVEAENPIRMTAANHSALSGGQFLVGVTVAFAATDIDSEKRIVSEHRIACCDADIVVDMIASY